MTRSEDSLMTARTHLYNLVAPRLRKLPKLKKLAIEADKQLDLMRHTAAHYLPQLIQPQTRNLTVAITARLLLGDLRVSTRLRVTDCSRSGPA